jgi:predicted acylesterase/phospholipase RssA
MTPEDVISEEPGTRKRRKNAPRVAIVAAGAGARGAFEAGAPSVLVPWLAKQQLRPTVFVGTSAGSINATLLAGTAELEPDDAAEKLLAFLAQRDGPSWRWPPTPRPIPRRRRSSRRSASRT